MDQAFRKRIKHLKNTGKRGKEYWKSQNFVSPEKREPWSHDVPMVQSSFSKLNSIESTEFTKFAEYNFQ